MKNVVKSYVPVLLADRAMLALRSRQEKKRE